MDKQLTLTARSNGASAEDLLVASVKQPVYDAMAINFHHGGSYYTMCILVFSKVVMV